MSEITACVSMKAEGKTRDCQYYGPRPREENLTPSRKYFFRAGGPRRKWKFHIWIFSHSFPSLQLRGTGILDWWYRVRNPGDNSDATPCHPALISDDGTLVFFARPLYQGCHPTFLGRDDFFQHFLSFLYSGFAASRFISQNCDFW